MILGIRGIEESTVYQDIFAQGEARGEAKGRAEGEAKGRAEGRVEEARDVLLRLGRRALGDADDATLAAINAIDDFDKLNEMLERLLNASSWEDVLADR